METTKGHLMKAQDKLFEYGQDIAKIEGAFISAQEAICREIDKSLIDLCSLSKVHLEGVVETVCKSVQFVLNGCGRSSLKWSAKERHLANKRIHSALLHTVLKSSGITCKNADTYYESVASVFPAFDWQLYVQLFLRCCWSELFIECVTMMSPEIALAVVQLFQKEVNTGDEGSYVVFHSALQVLLHKVFGLRTQINSSEFHMPFEFPFELVTNACKVTNTTCMSVHLECIVTALEGMWFRLQPPLLNLNRFQNEVKVLLNGLLTVLEGFLKFKESWSCQEIHRAVDLFVQLVERCMRVNAFKDSVKYSLESFEFLVFQQSFSSGIKCNLHIAYILLQLHEKLNMLELHLHKYEEGYAFAKSLFEKVTDIVKPLSSLYPLHSKENKSIVEEYIQMLMYVICTKMDGKNTAVKMLMQDRELIMRRDVISCFGASLPFRDDDDNNCLIGCMLMNTIINMDSPLKTRLTKVLFKILQDVPSIRILLLEEFLVKYGASKALKLKSFENDFLSFFNQSVEKEQAVKCILPLCLQSPEEVIKKVVDKVVHHGKSENMIHALVAVSKVCSYRESDDSPSMLVKALQPYFAAATICGESENNLYGFIEALLKVDTTSVLNISEFLNTCIICNLHTSSSKLHFSLRFFNMVLNRILVSKHIEWIKHLNVSVLIVLLSQLVNLSLVTYNGHLKESVICSTATLLQLQKSSEIPLLVDTNKKWLEQQISSLHPVVKFYVWDFIYVADVDISSLSVQDMICWYVIRKKNDVGPLKKVLQDFSTLARTVLIASLIPVLPHFTSDEFQHLSNILSHLSVQCPAIVDDPFLSGMEKLSDNERQVIEVCSLLVDALILLQKCGNANFDWLYISSCFTKVTKGNVASIKSDQKLVSRVFLEICRLEEVMLKNCDYDMEEHDMLIVLLHDILTEIERNSVEGKQAKIYQQLSNVMECL